ncbi:MAG: sortase [Anaerolineae bacterium]
MIPLGVVFLTIGLIVLATVAVVWLIAPAMMPPGLYAVVGPYLPHTAVAAAPLPTPAPTALTPTEEAVVLLPETPTEAEDALPDYFVSVEHAAKRPAGQGEPIRIVIPQIDLDAPVEPIGLEKVSSGDETYYQWQVPNDYIAGWQNNSARLGEIGNTVLNGHHNIYGEVFRYLIDLNEGDEIILYDNQRAYTYYVTTKEVLAERDQPLETRIANAQWIAPTDDERITLITCWPYTDNSHRLVIVAKPDKLDE